MRSLFLFEAEAHAFGFFGATNLADNSLAAAFALRDWLRETHLRFFQRHNTTLKYFAIETTDKVLISLVLIFSSYFDCHIGAIIANFLLIHNPYFVV